MNNKQILNALAIAITGILVAGIIIINSGFYHDDAYITLRYSRHVIEGVGAVWNPGEFVQGYSNFLHMILVVLLGKAGLDLVFASRVIGFISYLLLIVIVFAYCRVHANKAKVTGFVTLVPPILVASSVPLIVWSLGGLETVLFTLLITSAVLCAVQIVGDYRNAGIAFLGGLLFGFAVITRLDAAIFVAVSGVFLLLSAYRNNDYRDLVFMCLAGLLIVGPYLAWVYFYYGELLPTTYYAKATGYSLERYISGLAYITKYTFKWPLALVLFLLAAIIGRKGFADDRRAQYLLVIVLVFLNYVALVGGDHMQSYRFIVPIVPLVAIGLAMNISHLRYAGSERFRAILPLGIALLSVAQAESGRLNPREIDPAAASGSRTGQYINANWPEGSVIALNTAGSTPYFADQNIYIDMLGLNDPVISKRKDIPLRLDWQKKPGHAKGDGSYVLDREPDYIIVGPANGSDIKDPWFLSDIEMGEDSRFENNYEKFEAMLMGDSGNQYPFTYYKRR